MRWFLFNRTQSCGGNGNGSASSGPAYLNPSLVAEGDRPSPVEFEGLSCEWRRPIPLWRAPRIHGELKMLGIAISERTVSRVLRTIRSRPPSQTWKTFLRNHLGEIVSVDFFTVPTVRLRVLFVFLVLEHLRREVLHFNVTDHPTSEWVSQQMVEAFADREVPRYLIRDQDGVYGNEVRRRLHSLQIEEVLTAPQSPWQNAYAERLIGSIRRECLNHFIILNGRHLKRTLARYFKYPPIPSSSVAGKGHPIDREVLKHGAIVEISELGGLHHRL